ncbi:AraC family transcriptional regulator [Alteribacter keqinensis]|uniref:AraC family transcriptional regulator n=1 Tax=Alteribacter keqinensis TaxID=2483800 RepID=A0A3M7TQF2_9BACI|nr:GyrI-like domain-containing protein [Alteribacter keqinensis]RNA66919.1 AraC family transcriptional regulator [Alteribacter keqinensis]
MDMLKGMNDALSYIEENLGEHIDLKEVAKIALCSEYHFKRLFSLLSGITITEYIRRRRLTLAALDLKDSHVKVIDVALKYGYQSPDAFTRVFQNYHGVTPSAARNTEQNLKAYPRMTFQLTITGGTEMKYRIVEKEAFKVAGIKYEVDMVNGLLTPDYEHMMSSISDEKMKELESSSTSEPRGVIHVTANYSESAEGKTAFDQYIGAAVTQAPSGNDSVLDVPALTWAVFEAEGAWEEVEDHWQRIYSEWLPSSSCELAQGPEILASKKSEIWIPIKEK